MDRKDILLMGHGGAGNKIADTIMKQNLLFQGFFVNSSKTDMQTLQHFNDDLKNYLCTTLNNGTGRDRDLGKEFAKNKWMLMVQPIIEGDQSTIFIIFSLGGGSGSSSSSILLQALDDLKRTGELDDKITINIIGVLPDLNSPTIILENTLNTWNEIMNCSCINNMIFIDNNTTIEGESLLEDDINEKFAILFDKIFHIPDVNGTNFDNGNLGNIINAKGCTYIYDLPSGCENVGQAIKEADKNSVLAKLYTTSQSFEEKENGNKKIKCSYLGVSLNDERYRNEDFLAKYTYTEENYFGYNEEDNLLIITGMLPPYDTIQLIKTELQERKNRQKSSTDFSQFTTKTIDKTDNNINDTNNKFNSNIRSTKSTKTSSRAKMKRIMQRHLFS